MKLLLEDIPQTKVGSFGAVGSVCSLVNKVEESGLYCVAIDGVGLAEVKKSDG